MTLPDETVSNLARRLNVARISAQEIAPLREEFVDLDLTSAYAIQKEGIRLRREAGERAVGLKMGLTSEAKRKQMDLDSPCYGVLTDKMQLENSGAMKMAGSIHPKIEPEIAFIINRDLAGAVTETEVLDACSGVCAAMEILDSRYRGFKYFSLPDVVADNSSSSLFVLGDICTDFKNLDLANLQMTMKVNGEIAQQAKSSAISGNPVISIIQLCQLLAVTNETLPAGSIVLAGAATPAVSLEPGMEIALDVEGLAPVSLQIS